MNVDAIITGDIHIRDNTPIARNGNYLEDLGIKLDFVKSLQKKYDCLVIDAGDLLDKWTISPELTMWVCEHIPHNFKTIIGNHDMANRNLEYWQKGSLRLLDMFGVIDVLDGLTPFASFEVVACHYGGYAEVDLNVPNKPRVLLMHEMFVKPDETMPFETTNAKRFLKSLNGAYDLVVAGHNHEHFIIEHNNCKLINVGSMMRLNANQIDYIPKVHLWDSITNEIKSVKLPYRKDVISNTHLAIKKGEDERKERIKKLAEGIIRPQVKVVDFSQKISKYISENQPDEHIKKALNRWVENNNE